MNLDFEIKESEKIKGVWIIKPTISKDSRGNIWTSFLKNPIEELIPKNLSFRHDKFSESKKNVLRGIHGDEKSWKLVTCIYGQIHQVVVDCRKESPTYLNWQKFIIDKNNRRLLLLPPMMGNAYYVSSDIAIYHYKLAYHGPYYDAEEQFSIKWNDQRINITWPTNKPVLSERDK